MDIIPLFLFLLRYFFKVLLYTKNNSITAPQRPERGSGSLHLPLHLSGHVGGAGWTHPGRRRGRVRGCVHRGPGTRHPHHGDWKVSPLCVFFNED